MIWTNRAGKWLVASAIVAAAGAGGAGCLTRPVGQQPPTTKVNFTSTISQQAVDKIDLLVMIDNSASMGDKQEILADAVPNLVQGLLRPRCVNSEGVPQGDATADPTGSIDNNYGCPAGTEPEFKPMSDMHIGIISSSLGGMGGDICSDEGRHNDRGRLLNLVKGGGEVSEAKPSNFLSWYPSNKENEDKKRHPDPPTTPIGSIDALQDAFQKLVIGVEETGCGFEAQLESIYRFLIQPDPWVSVVKDDAGKARLEGIDVELLQQRADFLRPDSLVAIIALTDEDDSSADPLAVNGQGWAFMAGQFPGNTTTFRADGRTTTAPRPTEACKTNPGAEECTSCAFRPEDPGCNPQYYGPTDDSLNVRFHRMKERFGIDPQYPLRRYVDGFTKLKVPNRELEHAEAVDADGKRQIEGYTTAGGNCTNPLFAASLPRNPGDELCELQRSTRSPDLIFFAVVGGVPNELLHFNPDDPEANRISEADWHKILGRDPANFNYEGISPYMIQSVAPRPGLEPPSQTRGDNGSDPIHGREWDTNKDDLQFACTFDLPNPRIDAKTGADCAPGKNPPLCGAEVGEQVKAKAYPTIREFMVVRALGDQGIIASLCPITLSGDKNNPRYGYNPAVSAIVDRLKNALTTQCLPQELTRDENNEVPCLVLAQLAEESDSCGAYGLEPPPKDILDVFLKQQKEASGNVGEGGLDLSKLPVCEVPQATVGRGDTCKDQTDIAWCYVQNDDNRSPAGRCPQALIFSTGSAQLSGARFSLQCIQQFEPGRAAGEAVQE
jgi:hypothetical protein